MKVCLLLIIILTAGTVFSSSDLELQNVQGQTADNTLTFTLQYKNHGPAEAKDIGCRIQLYSEDGNVQTYDTPLEPLAAGSSSERDLSFELEIAAVVRAQIEIYDAVEADISPVSNIRIWAPGKRADLQITEAVIDTPQPVTGRSILLRLKIHNKGPVAIEKAKLTAELMIFRERALMIENMVRSLGPGEEKEMKITLALSRTKIQTEEGTIHLQATISDTGIEDSTPSNNFYLLPVLLTLRMPDLSVKNIQVSPLGVLSFSVANIGNAACGATTTLLYLNGALTRRYNTPSLSPSAEKRHQYGGTKVLPGTQVTIVSDFNADIQEVSEENNRFQFTTRR